jgi:hypothetical protein
VWVRVPRGAPLKENNMSRSLETARYDEMVGAYAIGQAINYLALEAMYVNPKLSYDSAVSAAGEEMAFALADLVKQYYSPRWKELFQNKS